VKVEVIIASCENVKVEVTINSKFQENTGDDLRSN
jgi:hypothetical protein